MSERAILKTLIVYLLIGCFLVSSVSCVYASSEASADSYENKIEVSEEEQPSEEAQNSEEQLESSEEQSQSSEYADMQSSGNDETESEGTQPPENTKIESDNETETNSSENTKIESDNETETNSSENTKIESDNETEANSSENTKIEPDNETETNLSENTIIEPDNETKTNSSENNETISSENQENQSSGDEEVGTEGTENQTSGEIEVAEDTENDSSHRTGNSYHIEHSEYTIIENNTYVQSESVKKEALESSESTENSKSAAQPSASVNLHGEKTRVVSGEDILLKLSAVNLITKPVMHVQVIIIPPSGMSVSSSEFVQSGAGQYTTTYELEPGQGRDIEVRIETNQPGDFNVEGRVVYYFGEDTENAEDYTLNLPIKVEKKSSPIEEESLPGFRLTSLVLALLVAFILKRR
ncbi:COG1361 family protein [Methanosarcina vacuolata]|uniref:hypothetical protein n=1 Tax=Methanosarcina vacuolata TaxID=2215 RepID=UPI000ACA55CF|nr:hypothetical protein [Methanosarcina vacuolata]